MKTHCASTLIISQPGPLRDGLRALLTAMSRVKIIGEASDTASALRTIQKHRPTLVLMDADLPGDEAWNTLQAIKTDCAASAMYRPGEHRRATAGSRIGRRGQHAAQGALGRKTLCNYRTAFVLNSGNKTAMDRIPRRTRCISPGFKNHSSCSS